MKRPPPVPPLKGRRPHPCRWRRRKRGCQFVPGTGGGSLESFIKINKEFKKEFIKFLLDAWLLIRAGNGRGISREFNKN